MATVNGGSSSHHGDAFMPSSSSEQQQQHQHPDGPPSAAPAVAAARRREKNVNQGYEQIMGISSSTSNYSGGDIIMNESSIISTGNGNKWLDARAAATRALSHRLMTFRKWLADEAHVTVHPAIAIVNGEATDGTRNAPVLALAAPTSLPTSPLVDNHNISTSSAGVSGIVGVDGSAVGSIASIKTNGASTANTAAAAAAAAANIAATTTTATTISSTLTTGGRIGSIDGQGDQSLYDRTMGCQVRAVREIRPNEVLMTIPRSAMITPDVVACSDAGRAVWACCKSNSSNNNSSTSSSRLDGFWQAFANTTECQAKYNPKISRNSGPQLLVKILQERKKAETAYAKRLQEQQAAAAATMTENGSSNDNNNTVQLAEYGKISTRAPVLAFLIHQRFSNQERPRVVSSDSTSNYNSTNKLQTGTPETFAPYARTLPAVVSLPICWRRSDLALMSGCIPGISFLQEVAARTMQLADEFIALVQAGILERFPETFAPGMLTWERWVWAASISSSRLLPATCYFDQGVQTAEDFKPTNADEFQSPPEIWNELGVMLPLLDMLNHESEAHQVTWKPCVPDNNNGSRSKDGDAAMDGGGGDDDDDDKEEPHPPRAIVHKKVRKGAEIYTAYGNLSNHSLVLQYGMAQMNNPADEVRIGWGLSESVGDMKTPPGFAPVVDMEEGVYEDAGTDKSALDAWWSKERLQLLQREAFSTPEGSSIVESLKQGKKLSAHAFSDPGVYHPVFVTAAVVATMPKAQVRKFVNDNSNGGVVVIYLRHLGMLRNFLAYSFSRKLEKLLQNLATGLKAHYGNLQLWTKSSKSGIRYQPSAQETINDGEEEGWQTFFDTHAYRSTMEVEKRYYAMGPECCVLTLYDGQLRALQSSLDGVVDDEKFKTGLQRQLVDLGFHISDTEAPEPDNVSEESATVNVEDDDEDEDEQSDSKVAVKTEDEKQSGEGSAGGSDKKGSPSRRKRNRKKSNTTTVTNSIAVGNRPPALKLHVGNLSYSTTPSDLYDFFSSIYGKDNILECHIPLERETGRSRGFGFVTMPENAAQNALNSGKKHEIDGRLLKVARSNSAGTSESGKARPGGGGPVLPVNDRCTNCGFSPRYCFCGANGPPRGGFPPPPHLPPGHPPHPHPPPHMMPPGPGPDRDHRQYGSHDGHRDDRYRDDHRAREEYYGRHRDRERDRDRAARYASPPRGGGGGYSDYDREDRYRSKRRRSRDRSPRSHSSSRRDLDDPNSTSRSSRRDSRRAADDDDWEESRRRSRSRSRSRSPRSRSRSRSPRERSRKKKSKKREL
jgi:RNA recognition motif-containing protein